jgi:hypothetical protein
VRPVESRAPMIGSRSRATLRAPRPAAPAPKQARSEAAARTNSPREVMERRARGASAPSAEPTSGRRRRADVPVRVTFVELSRPRSVPSASRGRTAGLLAERPDDPGPPDAACRLRPVRAPAPPTCTPRGATARAVSLALDTACPRRTGRADRAARAPAPADATTVRPGESPGACDEAVSACT